jgi:signal transduction histidine kinase
MPLHASLEPTSLAQMTVLALSIFNLVSFLWLACTVWLNGNRRSLITRVGTAGLGLSALFFFIHSLLIFSPLSQTSGLVSTNFLWHLIWLPALGVPYIWFVIGLHYASLINKGWRHRRPLLLIYSGLLGCSILLLLVLNQSTFTFEETIRLLAYSNASDIVDVGFLSPLVLLPLLFLCYVTFCAIGPWFTPGRVRRLVRVLWYACTGRKGEKPLQQSLADAFWDDPTEVELLEEPVLSWHLARPRLLIAALLMVGLTTSLGGLGVWSMVNWLNAQQYETPPVLPSTLDTIPLNLFLLDIFVNGSVALIILLIGYSIVRHGILIERPLARRGFLEQWRGVVIVTTAIAILLALLVVFTHSNSAIPLVTTSLATVAYALFTWSNYTAHDRYIALLGPFLRNTNLRHWLNTDLRKTEQSMENLFFHLCHDVLDVERARLVVFAGPVRRSFNYHWPASNGGSTLIQPTEHKKRDGHGINTPQLTSHAIPSRVRMTVEGQPMICWVMPIYDDLGPIAMLYLGPRMDGAIFSDEDMDLAHACGQRILDTLRDHEAMQAVAGLLRRRIVDVKLLGAQQRRVLHDEILPQMHLALLNLETMRRFVDGSSEQTTTAEAQAVVNKAIEQISDAHRQLAAMMRATTPSAPHRLERDGMMRAIHTMITHDFHQAFDEIEWDVSEETAQGIDDVVPPALAELIFAAVQEALRNAARHARGTDLHRRLHLTLRASFHPHLEIIVADDGVGIVSASSSTTGTGGGLLTHSALLAIAGGSLTVKSTPGEGVTVRILLPAEALR